MAKAPRNATSTAVAAGLVAAAALAATEGSAVLAAEFRTADVQTGYVEPTTAPTNVQVNPPILDDAAILARSKQEQADKAKAEKQEKADKKAAADKVKADAKAAKDAAKAQKLIDDAADKKAKAEARATAKTEREARLAEAAAGRNYTGSMLALSDRVKQGAYVKGATGQLHSGDDLATVLDGISPTDVIRIGVDVLKLEDNPYSALNIGQQSMNLRNRMRGAIKKDVLKLDDVKAYIERNKIVQVTAAEVAKARADKAERVAAAKAEREAKAAAKAAEPKTKTNVNGETIAA